MFLLGVLRHELALLVLEPYDGKLSRTVLRGEGRSFSPPVLPGAPIIGDTLQS